MWIFIQGSILIMSHEKENTSTHFCLCNQRSCQLLLQNWISHLSSCQIHFKVGAALPPVQLFVFRYTTHFIQLPHTQTTKGRGRKSLDLRICMISFFINEGCQDQVTNATLCKELGAETYTTVYFTPNLFQIKYFTTQGIPL